MSLISNILPDVAILAKFVMIIKLSIKIITLNHKLDKDKHSIGAVIRSAASCNRIRSWISN